MKDNFDLLPISEEVLGAYLEGSLSAEEAARVEQLIQTDDALRMVVDIVGVVDDSIDMSASIYDDFPHFDESFSLPLIPVVNEEDSIDSLDIESVDEVDVVEDDILGAEDNNALDTDIIDIDDLVDF